MESNKSPRKKTLLHYRRHVSDHDRRLLLIFSLLFFSLFFFSLFFTLSPSSTSSLLRRVPAESPTSRETDLTQSRIAICLVGGARRFELTGPSILNRILNRYPNADLFVNSPLDKNSYKLALLKMAPKIGSVRVFEPVPISGSDDRVRVLTAANSPNGIQGLLQYFNLVEGCLTLIQSYQKENKFTYDWIVRTRLDGYWSEPLDPDNFIPGQYVVPPGSSYGGLNDRLGIGDYATSIVALSRLSLIPTLDYLNYTGLNSERAFKAQLTSHNVTYKELPQPFCIVTDRSYPYPPKEYDVPVASMSSPGPLNGAKCRPCRPVCADQCVADVMSGQHIGWSWTPWRNGTLKLCDASREWEAGWEEVFDEVVGEEVGRSRKKIGGMNVSECVKEFEEMKGKAVNWDTPDLKRMCEVGLVK